MTLFYLNFTHHNLLRNIFLLINLLWLNFANAQTKISIYFENDQFIPSNIEFNRFKSFIDTLSNKENIDSVYIDSYCSDIGSFNYNMDLSSKRSSFLKMKLDSLLQTKQNYKIINHGKVRSYDGINNLAQTAKNRRTDIKFLFNSDYYKDSTIEVMPTIPQLNKIDYSSREYLQNDDEKINIINLNKYEVGDKFILSKITFKPGTAILQHSAKYYLRELLQELKETPSTKIEIRGHTYDKRNYESNQKFNTRNKLSKQRAKKIYEYLIHNGISKKRLTYKGLGSKYPLGKGEKFDRRIEIKVLKH